MNEKRVPSDPPHHRKPLFYAVNSLQKSPFSSTCAAFSFTKRGKHPTNRTVAYLGNRSKELCSALTFTMAVH